MVSVAAPHRSAAGHVHAEGGAEQRLLDVVHSHAVAAQDDLHEAGAYQRGQMFRSSGMNDHRSSYDNYLAAAFADSFEFPRDLTHHEFDFAFATDSGAHERKFCGRRATDSALLAGFALAHGLDPINSYYHPIALSQIANKADGRGRFGRIGFVDDDASVHPLAADSHPSSVQSYFRRVDRCDVKIVRGDAIDCDSFASRRETVTIDGVAPDDFYVTTIYPTEVRLDGRWVRIT